MEISFERARSDKLANDAHMLVGFIGLVGFVTFMFIGYYSDMAVPYPAFVNVSCLTIAGFAFAWAVQNMARRERGHRWVGFGFAAVLSVLYFMGVGFVVFPELSDLPGWRKLSGILFGTAGIASTASFAIAMVADWRYQRAKAQLAKMHA